MELVSEHVALLAVVEGVVEHGDERGRTLGFPTANLTDVHDLRLDGVYAGTAQIEPDKAGPVFVTAVSVGHRPTYYGRRGVRLVEAYLLDFGGNLYGATLRVELHHRIRPQRAYVDTPTLVQQLHVDVRATRAWAEAHGLGELLVTDRKTQGRRDRGRAATSDRSRESQAVDPAGTGSAAVVERMKSLADARLRPYDGAGR